MAEILAQHQTSSNKAVKYFLLVWSLVNLLQSYFTEVHPDEAYYWIYSRFLDWGYFDHPPMVALFIRAGDYLFHNELSLRLFTVFTSSFSWWILWQIVKKYQVEAKWFILVISSISIFHVFGFTTTPDAPLFFFGTLFYFFYQQYLEKDTPVVTVLLSLSLAGALYSKYHAVLLVVFTLMANPKLVSRKSFWLMAILTLILFLPHIFWQINHDFPSVKYHLVERSASYYKIEFTLLYLVGQLFMAGPLVGWFWFYQVSRFRATDIFTKTLLFNFVGTLLFFLINTSKVAVQPHWTLIGFLPLVMLVLISIKHKLKPTWLQPVLYVNILLLLLMRFGLMIKNPVSMKVGVIKSYFGNPEWAKQIKQKAGDAYVVFPDQFQDPSWYSYYTNSLKGVAYDSRFYRKTQFDIWPLEDSLQQKRVYFVSGGFSEGITKDTLNTPKGIFYGGWINGLRTYQKIQIEVNTTQIVTSSEITKDNLNTAQGILHGSWIESLSDFKKNQIKTGATKIVASPGKTLRLNLKITNPYPKIVDFSNAKQLQTVVLAAYIMQENTQISEQFASPDFNQLKLKPGEMQLFPFQLKTPLQKGKYTLLFSVKTTPFSGPRSSQIINLNIQ
ncbi:MAG: ArnT family glycosyltransferase [Janthinobacterium lividum]